VPGAEIVVIGMGQLGSLLAGGWRARGRSVRGVRRAEPPGSIEAGALLTLIAVAEDDLASALARVSPPPRHRVALLQNELVRPAFVELGLVRPTVAVVWFERKGGGAPRVLLPSLVAGPSAEVLLEAFEGADVPAERVDDGPALDAALAAKNLYILLGNLAGLEASEPLTMGRLLGERSGSALELAREIFRVEQARAGVAGSALDFDAALAVVEAATRADPEHGCRGRSAEARLARTAARAARLGVRAPRIEALARRVAGA
jgi:hypothetical protein